MAKKVPVAQIGSEIAKQITDYKEEVAAGVKEKIREVTKNMVQQLQQTSPRDTGEYARGWAQKTEYQSGEALRNRVYNKTKPQLTQLLENGHAKRTGGRVEGRPHIRPAEEQAEKDLGQKVREVVRW